MKGRGEGVSEREERRGEARGGEERRRGGEEERRREWKAIFPEGVDEWGWRWEEGEGEEEEGREKRKEVKWGEERRGEEITREKNDYEQQMSTLVYQTNKQSKTPR
jgi:hypothetical protein